ncbi:MAG: YitT family protein [Ruminococcaceae bacterium]|nr:YitT family protein [Oscillospiraceae bacterium]
MNKAKSLLSYATVVAMALLLALNYHVFIVQNGFAPAGLNGIATMIQYKTGFSISYMSLLINLPLSLFAYFFVHRSFAQKTLVFSLAYSVFFWLFQHTGLELIQYNAQGHDTIYPVIISGVVSGVVYGICFRLNASTGGTDVLSRYITTVKPGTDFFVMTFVLNAVVAVASLFVYAEGGVDYKPAALCITYCFISNFVGNQILKGSKTAYKFTIITTHPEEISQDIFRILQHSATRIHAVGGYSKAEKEVLLCVVNKHQLVDFQAILARYPDTFSFYELVNETYGNFARVK